MNHILGLLLREKVFWPDINCEIENLIKTCHACQMQSQPLQAPPVQMTELPNGPWKKVAIDLTGLLPSGESLLVVSIIIRDSQKWKL